MASSLISPQYHEEDNTFWTFSQASGDHQHNNFDTEIVPEFSDNFEVCEWMKYLIIITTSYSYFRVKLQQRVRFYSLERSSPLLDIGHRT